MAKETNLPEPTYEKTGFKVQAKAANHSDNFRKKITDRLTDNLTLFQSAQFVQITKDHN